MEKEIVQVKKGTLMEKFLEIHRNHANSWVFLHRDGAKKEILENNICISFYYGCGHEWKHIFSAHDFDKPEELASFDAEDPQKVFFLKLTD